MIRFQKRKLKTKLKSPLLNFSVDEQDIEFRKDPLTKRWCRINIKRIKRAHPGLAKDGKYLRHAVKLSKVNCPFCYKNIGATASRFVEFEEMMKEGESILFPNIFPYSKYHAVVVFTTKKHFIDLNEMKPKLLFDSLKNCLKFIKVVNNKNPKFKYPSINFNFMPPAAASIFHPHFQVIVDDRPTFMTDMLIKKSLAYYKKSRSNYWLDLLKTEKKNKERFIGKKGSFSWIADFAPIKNNQISGIISKRISCVSDFKTREIKDLSNSLSLLFKKLWWRDIRSLTMSTFSGPMGKDISKHFLTNLKIISRPNLSYNYVSDIGFMELVHQESIIETLPENVSKDLKFT